MPALNAHRTLIVEERSKRDEKIRELHIKNNLTVTQLKQRFCLSHAQIIAILNKAAA